MATRSVNIKVGLETLIELDGVDLTDQVNFIGLNVQPGLSLPVVTLGVSSQQLQLEGQAIVELGSDINEAAILGLIETLRLLDPAEIEKEALESELMDSTNGMVKSVIEVILEKLRCLVST